MVKAKAKDGVAPVTDKEQVWVVIKKVLPYLGLATALIVALMVQGNDRQNAKEQTCEGILENRILLGTLLATTLTPEALVSPEAQRFAVTTQTLLFEPLTLCEKLGVESRILLVDESGRPITNVPIPENSTPITIPAQAEGDEAIGPEVTDLDNTTIVSVLVEGTAVEPGGEPEGPAASGDEQRGPPGPEGPTGPQGPPGSSPEDDPGVVDGLICDTTGFRC